MIEKVEIENTEEMKDIVPVQEEASEDVEMLDLTVDEVVELAAELVSSFRCKSEEAAENFKKKYITINKLVLTIIGFNKALRSVSIQNLPPEYALIGGFGCLVVTGIFLPTGEPKKPVKAQPAPQKAYRKPEPKDVEKKVEEKKLEEKKEEKVKEPKIEEIDEETMKKFYNVLKEREAAQNDVSSNG